MPPKKAVSKKTVTAKQKLVDDATFGMKNKKGNKNQQIIQNAKAQVEGQARKHLAAQAKGPTKKQVKAAREEELRALGFKITNSKQPEPEPVALQPGEVTGPVVQDNEDIEIYGFEHVEGPKDSLEETLERLRQGLTGTLTKVTPESFAVWKQKKLDEKMERKAKKAAKRSADIKSGKVAMTGREMYEIKTEVFVDDELGDEEKYEYVDPHADDPDPNNANSNGGKVEIDEELFADMDIDEELDGLDADEEEKKEKE